MDAMKTDPFSPTVLYLDGEATNRSAFQEAFSTDFTVLLADDLEEALGLMATQEVHVVVSNQHLPGILGSTALKECRTRFPQVRRLLITAHADLQAMVDALNEAGVCQYIEKPWDSDSVRAALDRAVADFRAEHEREEFTRKLMESNRQLEFALRQSLLS